MATTSTTTMHVRFVIETLFSDGTYQELLKVLGSNQVFNLFTLVYKGEGQPKERTSKVTKEVLGFIRDVLKAMKDGSLVSNDIDKLFECINKFEDDVDELYKDFRTIVVNEHGEEICAQFLGKVFDYFINIMDYKDAIDKIDEISADPLKVNLIALL